MPEVQEDLGGAWRLLRASGAGAAQNPSVMFFESSDASDFLCPPLLHTILANMTTNRTLLFSN